MSTIPDECDVIIIGGGPTGSTAASDLAQKGRHVVVLEKKEFPRNAVGESVIPHFWKYADQIGVSEKIKNEGFIEKTGGITFWHGKVRQMSFKDFAHDRPALHVERDVFDNILFEHAKEQENADVFENVDVKSVRFSDDNAEVEYIYNGEVNTIKAKYVLDASGQSAVLSKQMKTRIFDEDFRFISLWGYFENSKYVAKGGKVYPFSSLNEVPPTTFVTSIGEWGWAWHIPQRKRTSVGLVIPLSYYHEVIKDYSGPEDFYLKTCLAEAHIGKLLDEATYVGEFGLIRDYSYQPINLCGKNYFLAGDAAAFIDPVFSLGVVISMFSGILASWAIHHCLENPDKAQHYADIYTKQYKGRLAVARALAVPSHECDKDELAMQMINFERPSEIELMYAASLLTNRSEHIENMLKGRIQHSEKVHEIPEINFG